MSCGHLGSSTYILTNSYTRSWQRKSSPFSPWNRTEWDRHGERCPVLQGLQVRFTGDIRTKEEKTGYQDEDLGPLKDGFLEFGEGVQVGGASGVEDGVPTLPVPTLPVVKGLFLRFLRLLRYKLEPEGRNPRKLPEFSHFGHYCPLRLS